MTQDFVSEVGLLPPALLPVGNKRLYQYQIESIVDREADIYLSLPGDYQLESFDRQWLEANNVKLIFTPNGLSLGESILYCWNSTGKKYSKLSVLHGDTLLKDANLDFGDNVSVHRNRGYYHRAVVNIDNILDSEIIDDWAGDDDWVLSGYFSFSNPQLLMKGIVETRGDFVTSVQFYSKQQGLEIDKSGEWLDFGHINSFFRSRTTITTQRAFNEMSMTPRVVSKKSQKKEKIAAEANWFKEIPSSLKIHIPSLLDSEIHEDSSQYKLEYLYLLPLADLFVFGNLNPKSWKQIFKSSFGVLGEFSDYTDNSTCTKSLDAMYAQKTLSRLDEFHQQTGFDVNRKLFASIEDESPISLVEMAFEAQKYISETNQQHIGVSHGDFCFSNILFDSRTQAIKVIDPRGINNSGAFTIYGDRRYDVAKYYHSVVGFYDYVIAGRYILNVNQDKDIYEIGFNGTKNYKHIELMFKDVFFNDDAFNEEEILAITIHLFLSMLPLHFDRPDRQEAMIANAIRLYKKLKNTVKDA
ncbi:hypothetical protein [Thalassotalea sp. Y01]|uniref:hypothetical protein n=1 Tax=Thalassotalea sp. Y01 TaxID=2729613 RepID=UPI00145D5575|nr:hypothetical protein [Thalassotalea sp. Y01]NMP14983.1 hypothetical protein [Thalassotalea sp. Y01]